MINIWKIHCMENYYPGMWQRWFINQCAAIGWPPGDGFNLEVHSTDKSWNKSRNRIKEIEVGDYIVVALKDNRVGRIGEVTGKAIEDKQWNPLVPERPGLKFGEMGRRILVRWDLINSPRHQDLIVQLPADRKFTGGELRPAISRIKSYSIDELRSTMADESNWVSLRGKFIYEKALSDYISNYPHHLEDGLLPHPDKEVREVVVSDKRRIDVLLIDRDNQPVIVECKQYAPGTHDLEQLRHYMKKLEEETKKQSRGILVHGGAQKVSSAIIAEAKKKPQVEIVSYSLDVNFKSSYIVD